jgi:hypothetical protein
MTYTASWAQRLTFLDHPFRAGFLRRILYLRRRRRQTEQWRPGLPQTTAVQFLRLERWHAFLVSQVAADLEGWFWSLWPKYYLCFRACEIQLQSKIL